MYLKKKGTSSACFWKRAKEIQQHQPGNSSVLLQYFGLSGLWIAKIHHLVKQFVDDNKVVSNTLLFQFLKVICEDLHDLV